ncbi:MAG: tetratricopeptide repeat protein [Rhodospirillales bacterium]|nr:tetratricopeptide repeat protein [Rhodospirillales bacterium]
MNNQKNFFDKALGLHQSGRIREAIDLYNQILRNEKDNAQVCFLLGTASLQIGQQRDGIQHLKHSLSLNSKNAAAHNNLGKALADIKQPDEALKSLDRALEINPDYAEAHNNRGNVLADLKRLEEALESYDKAAALMPHDPEVHINRGSVLRDLKRLDEALESLDKALALKPDSTDAYNYRGNILRDLKRPDEALESFDKALELNAHDADVYNNRGVALKQLKRLDEALVSYDKALALNPHDADAYNNRGNVLTDLKRLDEALASYDKALSFKPDYAEAYWNKSLLLILMGRYLEGWELYEWRLQNESTKNNYHSFPKLIWRGRESIQNKKLLIHAEQGSGDVIQFCRYLPQVRSLGAEIIFEVPKSLMSFVSTLNCPMTVVAKGAALPDFDAYCPIMSLPYVFKTRVETIPTRIPYLFADQDKVQFFRKKLGARTKPRVGLVWSGAAGNRGDADRSIRLKELLPLLDLPIEWYSLQNEIRQYDLEILKQQPKIQQYHDDLKDFSDISAFIECLDFVVSVDTSFVHVAGAIGKPVWVLLPFIPDCRWLLGREDSPWYPTARLFRQPDIGDWRSVIAQVAETLSSQCVRFQHVAGPPEKSSI